MKVAVLSGKGGTGKTLVSVNLAALAKDSIYIDCDVEEPNGHLFLKPENIKSEKIFIKIPVVDEKLCNGCRKCIDFCKFNALAYINNKLIICEEICHSCGGCILFCPEKALSERDKTIGEIQRGVSRNASLIRGLTENIQVFTGILDTGEASGVPIIKKLLQDIPAHNEFTFIDCPPGSACIVMESIVDADYCLLIAEPTLFGVHNLKMVYELVNLFKKPHGVVINKCMEGENPAEKFCIDNNIKILAKIPFDHELGTINSNALILVSESKKYWDIFFSLLQVVTKEVQDETIINP